MINDPRPYELRLCCRCEHSVFDTLHDYERKGTTYLRCRMPHKQQRMQTGDNETKCPFFSRIDASGMFGRGEHGRTALFSIRNERRLREEPLTLKRRVAER